LGTHHRVLLHHSKPLGDVQSLNNSYGTHKKNSYGNINYIAKKIFFNPFILFIEYIYTTVAIGTSNKKEGKNNDK
jgi:hypothetical protein